ncbi:CC domain-containing protein [Caenorhabditis elegans]|uniref:CC domain-containing protein n=1 Tax=Caenorhabditis elegans TaxID=6239 RepID=Q9N498_CAEEL|nr:CC domain-containing protein [Caenorhabditis elegans]CCD72972.1 CC domain-containing protein [Caenorhabditis elegans]|eukprot:NP_494387.1 Uncharacterized protein CELE_Y110A2AL.3 [Caenorhabditis elegans]
MKQAIDSVKNTMFRSFLVAVFVLAVGIEAYLDCKGPMSPAIFRACPVGEVLVLEDNCCDSKDVFDTLTATCLKGYGHKGAWAPAINNMCPTGSRVTKGYWCCYTEDIQSATNA